MTETATWLGIYSEHLHSVDSAEASLRNALDGTGAYWSAPTDVEHWFILDLGRSLTVTKVRGRSNTTQDPVDVDIYVSDDTGSWGTAVATGISTFQDTDIWQEVDTTDKKGRYVKVVVNSTELSKYLRWGNSMTIFDVYVSDAPDTAELIINLTNDDVATSSGSYVDCDFRIPWDGSKYDKIEQAFLVVNIYGLGSGGDPTAIETAQLYDFTNSAEITTATGGTGYGLFKSINCAGSLPSGAAELGVNLKLDYGVSCNLRGAWLVLKLVAPANAQPIKARIIRDVGWTPKLRQLWNTTYTEVKVKRLYYDSSKYDGVDNIYFGAYAKVNNAMVTGYWELWNNTDSSQLSELTWSETSYTYKTSSAISPTTAKEYTTRGKIGGFLAIFYPRCAHIIIDCSDLSKYEYDLMIHNDMEGDSYYTTSSYAYQNYQASYFNVSIGVTKILYHEMCAKQSAGNTGNLKIQDDGVDMTNSVLSKTGSTYSRVRGGSALTEPANLSTISALGQGYTSGGGQLQTDVNRVIVEVSSFDKTTSTGTNSQVNIGDSWKDISAMHVNISDTWKEIAGAQVNISDTWKTIF